MCVCVVFKYSVFSNLKAFVTLKLNSAKESFILQEIGSGVTINSIQEMPTIHAQWWAVAHNSTIMDDSWTIQHFMDL